MRFDIKKLRYHGLDVIVTDDSIEIHAPPIEHETWLELRKQIVERITDQGLKDYVMGAYLDALTRAQIIELAE